MLYFDFPRKWFSMTGMPVREKFLGYRRVGNNILSEFFLHFQLQGLQMFEFSAILKKGGGAGKVLHCLKGGAGANSLWDITRRVGMFPKIQCMLL